MPWGLRQRLGGAARPPRQATPSQAGAAKRVAGGGGGAQGRVLAGWDARISAGISLHQGTPPAWGCVGSGGNLLTSWCGKQVSNLPRVIGRAHGRAQTRTQASWVPGGILSQPCSSRPRLGPGRPSPPTPAPQSRGFPAAAHNSRVVASGQAAGRASPRVRTASPRSLSAQSAPPPGRQGRLALARAVEDAGRASLRALLAPGREGSGSSVVEAASASHPTPPARKGTEAQRSPSRRSWARWQRTTSSDPASAMWLSLLLLALLLLLTVLCKGHLRLSAGGSPNPFSEDVRRPPAPLVTDKEARKKVLKRGQREGTLGCKAAFGWLAFPFRQVEPLSTWASVSPYVKCWEGFLARGGALPYCLLPVRAYALAGPGP